MMFIKIITIIYKLLSNNYYTYFSQQIRVPHVHSALLYWVIINYTRTQQYVDICTKLIVYVAVIIIPVQTITIITQ